MSSNKRASQYGRPMICSDISFFDILKKGILKVEESCLRVAVTGNRSEIVFLTIPLRN